MREHHHKIDPELRSTEQVLPLAKRRSKAGHLLEQAYLRASMGGKKCFGCRLVADFVDLVA
jgi:hypothetical protein